MSIAEYVKSKPGSVSLRQHEVWLLRQRGLTNREVAAELGITYDTVRVHLRILARKARRSAAIGEMGAGSPRPARGGPQPPAHRGSGPL